MNFNEQRALIKSTREVHSNWYRTTYPDVAALNMDPAEHYLRYGAAMKRNPGNNFDTAYYLSSYPDAAASGLNPLVHYALYGKALGYARRRPKRHPDLRQLLFLRTKLLSLGFTEAPLAELAELAKGSDSAEVRAMAARELALWHLRQKTDSDYELALTYLEAARRDAPSLEFCRKLAVAELLCHHFRGDDGIAEARFNQALLAGELSGDLFLAAANTAPTAAQRVRYINRALSLKDIPPVALLPEDGRPAYDRLTTAVQLPKVMDGPRVSVLIAAYDAADTLPTALRSLQEQTWQNLEILVLDDCSPNPDTVLVAEKFAESDPRIRVIRMEQNGGAYVARNRGLDESTGTYVTLHDADDWSHPLKIETQVRFLEENPEVMGCTSQQSRATELLAFPKWAGAHGSVVFCKENVSSFMQRHEPVFERIGYWDPVRFGADSEKMRRVRLAFGEDSVVALETGPMSFQRISESSIVSDGAFGVDGYFFGTRLVYFEGQLEQHKTSIEYRNPSNTHFAVPQVMRPDRKRKSNHYDVIILSEFRMHGGSTRSNIEEILCQRKAGLRTGVVHMCRYDYPPNKRILPEVREVLDDDTCVPIAYGESVTCDLLIIRYPPVLEHMQRYVPDIVASEIRVIVNQPPMSDYGPEGERRYHLGNCARNLRSLFGKDAVWHPIGPLVRDALHKHHADELCHIDLSDEDWSNIIDIDGWDRGERLRGPNDRLRVGRHSRDSEHKWPSCAADILAAYPAIDDVEVHVLGGADSAKAMLGEIPSNWTVYEFGTVHPKDFLKEIDVWIYFSHPDWLESFGRTIIEAMAVGVPVILPEDYRPLFKDAALYATPETAMEIARAIHADRDAYDKQAEKALAYVRDHFSYSKHVERIRLLFERSRSLQGISSPGDKAQGVKLRLVPTMENQLSDQRISARSL